MTSAVLTSSRRPWMRRYALWQLADFALNVAIISTVLFGLLGLISILNVRAMEDFARTRGSTVPLPSKLSSFLQLFSGFGVLGPIIAASNVVSQDRTMGYTRFLFAKPVSPRWFYAQLFVVKLVGFVLVGSLLLAVYGAFEPPTFSWKAAVDLSLEFMGVGGIVFLLSVVSRYDGVIAGLFLLVSATLRDRWEALSGLKHAATYLLPPVNHISGLHEWLVGMNALGTVAPLPFPWKWAFWNAGYGLACVALGLYLLRRVPLTKA